MSATTFLLILAGVIVVFVGFIFKSWFELSGTTRARRRDGQKPDDGESSG